MRKPISLAVAKDSDGFDVIYALCDDCTIWALHDSIDSETHERKFEWAQLDVAPIPSSFIETHTDTSWASEIIQNQLD